jgi:predicted enzyme related to lactoylglutathione lyase
MESYKEGHMLKFGSVMIGSEDPTRLSKFYGQLFGDPQWQDGDWSGWKVGTSFITIGPHSDVRGTSSEPSRLIFNFESKTFDKDLKRIRASGAEVVQEPYSPEGAPEGGKVATFADVDGNYFQLMTPMKM